MRIQYCSDLHLEFEENSNYIKKNPLSVNGELLIMAGDIVPLHERYFGNDFFNFISDNFKQVFWIPGNHEFYQKDLTEFAVSYNIPFRNNINIVNNVELVYDDIRFVFSTLWSRISPHNENIIERSLADFEWIFINNNKIKTEDFNRLHQESLAFIKQSLETVKDKTVVVTHHVPSNLCNGPQQNESPLNEAFCVNLTDYISESNVSFWIYGHNHFNMKAVLLGKTILATNQMGYVQYGEHKSFNNRAYISV